MTIEEPEYSVKLKESNNEVRDYAARVRFLRRNEIWIPLQHPDVV